MTRKQIKILENFIRNEVRSSLVETDIDSDKEINDSIKLIGKQVEGYFDGSLNAKQFLKACSDSLSVIDYRLKKYKEY